MKIPLEIADAKIYAASVGFESLDEVDRFMGGWKGHIDGWILGDGRYKHYPADHDYSKDGWLQYAYDNYNTKDCHVVTYKYAGYQLDKRQRYLDIAGELGVDYLIIVDTDEYVDPDYTDFNAFYRNLIKIADATGDELFSINVFIPSEQEWAKQGNVFKSNLWRQITRIHKNPGSMRYCASSHWNWCRKDVTDDMLIDAQLKIIESDKELGISAADRPFLHSNPLLLYARNQIDGVRLKTDRKLRSAEQIAAGAEWAFLNGHEEKFGEHCLISKMLGRDPPPGYESWTAYRNTPHQFDKQTGKIILRE